MSFSKKLFLLSAGLTATSALGYAQNFAYPAVPGPAAPGEARPYVWIAGSASPSATVAAPGNTCGVAENLCYYLPASLQTAYAVNAIAHGNGGQGLTVGIVDAYYNSQTEGDLAAFSATFNLPACSVGSGCLTIVSQTGVPCSVANACVPTPSSPPSAQEWSLETDLDIEAVHAMAPNAHILLVTANNSSFSDLATAVQYAYGHANLVSNSWGGGEFSVETALDSLFAASPVPILFSSGDTGGIVEYPCASPNVLCVGGTHLQTTAAAIRSSESAWGGADTSGGGGGGCSAYEPVPSYQASFTTSMCGTMRGVPDIAAIGDPLTGFATVLGSFAAQSLGVNYPPGNYSAFVIGGTSLASPITAGILALIDADRIAQGKSLVTNAQINSYLYNTASGPLYHARFFDVTTGTTGFAAVPGWDRATGVGVILGPAMAAYLCTLP